MSEKRPLKNVFLYQSNGNTGKSKTKQNRKQPVNSTYSKLWKLTNGIQQSKSVDSRKMTTLQRKVSFVSALIPSLSLLLLDRLENQELSKQDIWKKQ